MKNIFFVVFLCLSIKLFAQTKKGDFLVGGMVGFQTNTGDSYLTINPNIGYFVKSNFALGVAVNLLSNKVDIIKHTEFDFGPLFRYYFGKGQVRPFASLKALYLNSTYKDLDNDAKSTSTGFGYNIGAGASAFFSPSVAFEGFFGYNFSQFETAESTKGFGLSLGFQVYINRHRGAKK